MIERDVGRRLARHDRAIAHPQQHVAHLEAGLSAGPRLEIAATAAAAFFTMRSPRANDFTHAF